MTPERLEQIRQLAEERPYVPSIMLRDTLDALEAERARTQEIRDSWTQPGLNPRFHRESQMLLRFRWPRLYFAIEKVLVR